MHAFVNSDDLALTANRGSVENTSQELLADIEATVRAIFAERIEETPDYLKFQDELLAIERHRHAEKEAQDYKRRLKRLEAREITVINGVEFYSPETETDVIALVSRPLNQTCCHSWSATTILILALTVSLLVEGS